MLEKYGLIDENAIAHNHQKLWKYCQHVAGASLQAANLLTTSNDEHCIAMNWGSGRQHAGPSLASGFCFMNDVALSMHNLSQCYDKILCIDIDTHYGDGIQNAF